MNRRAFASLLGSAAAAWPVAVPAQQRGRRPTIGFMGAGTPMTWSTWVKAFVQRLDELGWTEGRTITIEYRWAEGRSDRYKEMAEEFVRRPVDVIVTVGSAVPAAKQATSVVPIVFAVAVDPLGSAQIASLAHPGGNVTGLSSQSADLGPKRLELLREALPRLRTLAIIGNANAPPTMIEAREVEARAQTLGIHTTTYRVRTSADISAALDKAKSAADALYVCTDPLINSNRVRINTVALAARLPTMHGIREYVEIGGLMSYGPSYPDLFRRSADFVDKILRGTRPGDIPVEQPTKFYLVINLLTANAIGLTIPPMLLARADEVIE
jgi:putative ABC transport system substrate-binding protein